MRWSALLPRGTGFSGKFPRNTCTPREVVVKLTRSVGLPLRTKADRFSRPVRYGLSLLSGWLPFPETRHSPQSSQAGKEISGKTHRLGLTGEQVRVAPCTGSLPDSGRYCSCHPDLTSRWCLGNEPPPSSAGVSRWDARGGDEATAKPRPRRAAGCVTPRPDRCRRRGLPTVEGAPLGRGLPFDPARLAAVGAPHPLDVGPVGDGRPVDAHGRLGGDGLDVTARAGGDGCDGHAAGSFLGPSIGVATPRIHTEMSTRAWVTASGFRVARAA